MAFPKTNDTMTVETHILKTINNTKISQFPPCAKISPNKVHRLSHQPIR